jgi:hypothetical protein
MLGGRAFAESKVLLMEQIANLRLGVADPLESQTDAERTFHRAAGFAGIWPPAEGGTPVSDIFVRHIWTPLAR